MIWFFLTEIYLGSKSATKDMQPKPTKARGTWKDYLLSAANVSVL